MPKTKWEDAEEIKVAREQRGTIDVWSHLSVRPPPFVVVNTLGCRWIHQNIKVHYTA